MMVNNLEEFVEKVEEFNKLQSSEMIDYFAYYLQTFLGQSNIKTKDIEDCFSSLTIPSYILKYPPLSFNKLKINKG